MKNVKRLLSCLVSAAMCMSLLPAAMMPSVSAKQDPEYILMLGDSIASGYGLAEGEYRYADYLKEYLGMESIDYAKPGQTTGELLELLNNEEVQIDIPLASVICVSIGGNDLIDTVEGYLNTLLETYNTTNGTSLTLKEYVQTVVAVDDNLQTTMILKLTSLLNKAANTYKTNIQQIEASLLEQNPDAKIVVQTVYNPINMENPVVNGVDYSSKLKQIRKFASEQLLTLNDALQQTEGLTYVDVNAAFKDTEWVYTNMDPSNGFWQMDVHPNALGHAVIAAEILNSLGAEGGSCDQFNLVLLNNAAKLSDAEYDRVHAQLDNFITTGKDGIVYSIAGVKGKPGETVEVPITISGDTGTAGMVLELQADAGLTIKRRVTGNAYEGAPDWNPKTLTYVWYTANGRNQVAADGAVLATLQFTIAEDAVNGMYEISFDEAKCDIVDENGTALDVTFENGGVEVYGSTVPEYKLGDVNMDGALTVADAVTVLQACAQVTAGGESPLTDQQKKLADMNQDGNVSVGDAVDILVTIAQSMVGYEPDKQNHWEKLWETAAFLFVRLALTGEVWYTVP